MNGSSCETPLSSIARHEPEDYMKSRAILVFTILFGILGCSQRENEPEFRNTNWGMSRNEVKFLETSKLVVDDARMLSYEGMVGGLPCQVVYLFVKDQLVGSHYFFKTEHSQDADHIEGYRGIKEAVTEKYGSPLLDEATWKNDRYKNDPDKVALAVKLGHVNLAAQWASPRTEIWLFLVGENGKMKLSMRYTSKKLAHLRDKEQKDTTGASKSNTNEF